jgi:glycosyltransferase involved in cell wall biosynthesis
MGKRSERVAHRRWPTASGPSWICCQLGAREHYAVPGYFHLRGRLAALLTDAWIRPGTLAEKLAVGVFRPLRDRFDRQLADAPVYHFTSSLSRFEAGARLQGGISHWERIQSRNAWFQKEAVSQLNKLGLLEARNDAGPPTVFAYSYAARRIFEAARGAGCRTVLGQIDPGPYEEELVAGLYGKCRALEPDWHPAPSSYWHEWQEELALADHVVVNSRWSREALTASGISADKICVVPLAFEPPAQVQMAKRVYPAAFTEDRPLNVLFLGSLILRKGIVEMLEAADLLANAPVVLWFIGTPGIQRLPLAAANPRIRWLGSVPRATVHVRYQASDVFILPTHSDGFGLTQLEAQAWGLPIIASQHCGEVVEHGANGLLLPEVTASAIADAISWMLANPSLLPEMSQKAVERSIEFRPEVILKKLDDTCLNDPAHRSSRTLRCQH